MKTNTLIVGAGPIGGFLGSKLSDSTIIDQKTTIGNPVRCTGILTTELEHLMPKKDIQKCTLNKIKETEVIGPNETARFNLSTNYIICNTTFEQLLLEKAQDKGSNLLLQHKYLKSTAKGHEVRDMKTKEKKIIKSPELIGCDGPQSEVNKQHQIIKKRKNYIGLQVRLKVKEHENIIKFYPHIAKYAWYTPESETIARVGICTDVNAPQQLDLFLKRFKGKVLEKQAGFIPYHKPFQPTVKQNKSHKTILMGDAALQVKNTTGGGIIPGMSVAKHFVDLKGNYTKQPVKVTKELYNHFLVHNLIKNNTDKEWNLLIKAAKKHKADLESIHRDELIKLMPRLAMNPKLVGFGLKKVLSGSVSLV